MGNFWAALGLLSATLIGCGGAEFTAGDANGGAGAAGASSIAGGSSGGAAAAGAAHSTAGGSSGGAAAARSIACDRSAWTATAFASFVDTFGGPSESALDGDPSTRWSGGTPQDAGQWFELMLGEGQVLESVQLDNSQFEGDMPTTMALLLDGSAAPSTYVKTAPGHAELKPGAPRSARTARLLLTGTALNWWSIGEVTARCSR
jgi:hypothetical protein